MDNKTIDLSNKDSLDLENIINKNDSAIIVNEEVWEKEWKALTHEEKKYVSFMIEKNNIKIKNKSQEQIADARTRYNEYVELHRGNVKRAFNFIKKHLPYLINNKGKNYEEIIEKHDLSKFGPEEYDAYVRWWTIHDRSKESEVEFRKAFLHHVHNNPHHWQYWCIPKDKGGFHTIQMPYEYIIEMVCDWWSFSFKENNLFEMFDVWEGKKDHIILHPETRKDLELILIAIHGYLFSNVHDGKIPEGD